MPVSLTATFLDRWDLGRVGFLDSQSENGDDKFAV